MLLGDELMAGSPVLLILMLLSMMCFTHVTGLRKSWFTDVLYITLTASCVTYLTLMAINLTYVNLQTTRAHRVESRGIVRSSQRRALVETTYISTRAVSARPLLVGGSAARTSCLWRWVLLSSVSDGGGWSGISFPTADGQESAHVQQDLSSRLRSRWDSRGRWAYATLCEEAT
jgi:hypothetical protein